MRGNEHGPGPSIARTAALVAIVAAGAYLRLSGIDWGHRHPIHTDEQVYVENVVAMLDAGDFDHRFYTYPGLFYYLLRGALWFLPPEARHSADAYILARAVVACLGLLNVPLLAFVISRLHGTGAALVAAGLAALSPVVIDTSHQVRPDVLLQLGGLAAVAVLPRLGTRLRWDAAAGVVIGVASALKFSGVLLVPSYLLARALARGPRLRGLLIAGALTVAIVAVSTPYALLNFAQYQHGPGQQLRLYGVGHVSWGALLSHLRFYLWSHREALGVVGGMTATIGGAMLLWRDGIRWSPLLLYPLVNVVVMSMANQVFARWILPAIDVVVIAAVVPIAVVAARLRPALRLGALILAAAACSAAPALASLELAKYYSSPRAQDKAQDWLLAHLDPGARILETRPAARLGATPGAMVGLPADRFESVFHYVDEDPAGLLPLVARHMDAVLMNPGQGWRELRTAHAATNAEGATEVLVKVPVDQPRYEAIPISRGSYRASWQGDIDALFDGDLATGSATPGPMVGEEWIEIAFERPYSLGRLELVVAARPTGYDPEIALEVSDGSAGLVPVATTSARPRLRDQAFSHRPPSQDLLCRPRKARSVRVRQLGRRDYPWRLVEVRLAARRRPEAP